MSVRAVIETLNRMTSDGVVSSYAIGGAVGATFYLEPVATLDVDVFVALTPAPGSLILDPRPVLNYLALQGCPMQGEYVMIADWPVQFLAPASPLVDEALEQAVEADVDGVVARVFTAEHLAAICLETGRAKDKARLLQFIESSALDDGRFQSILGRHGLSAAWDRFRDRFMGDEG